MDYRINEKSELRKYYELLELAIEKRRSIICIQTDDYTSEIERIKKIFKTLHFYLGNKDEVALYKRENINLWFPDEQGKRGLYNVEDPKGDTLYDSIMAMPGSQDSSKAILVLCGLHYIFDSNSSDIPRLSSLLHEFYVTNEKKKTEDRSIIIIISPKFLLPIELKHCVYTIVSPYPDETDIAEELGIPEIPDVKDVKITENNKYDLETIRPYIMDSSYKPEGKPYIFASEFFYNQRENRIVYEENKRNLIKALKGLRISEINKILAYSDEPYKIKSFDIRLFIESKKRLVQESGLLKVEDVPDNYEKYVGDIEGLKYYMQREKCIIDNRAYYNSNMPLPKGILLVGPPGCGKSETSKAIASILDLPLFSMDMGRLLGGLMGQSEHNFERALSIAEAAQPCVLRIDEIEKAFAGSGKDANEQTMTHIVGHFLTWMQERKTLVYLVATANDLNTLRPEFLRKGRWDEIFYLTYPTADGMKKIINSCLSKYGLHMEDEIVKKDECGNEEYVIGEETETIIDSFYRKHKGIKVSGAEIADIIEQQYKDQFWYDCSYLQSKEYNDETSKDRLMQEEHQVQPEMILSISLFESNLDKLAEKKNDNEIKRQNKIDEEIADIEIQLTLRNKDIDDQLEVSLKKQLEKKYSDDKIQEMISEELSRYKINAILSGNKFNYEEDEIKSILENRYQKSRLVEEELQDFQTRLLMQEEHLSADKEKKLRNLLEKKYKADYSDIIYEEKGYKSASIPDPSVEDKLRNARASER